MKAVTASTDGISGAVPDVRLDLAPRIVVRLDRNSAAIIPGVPAAIRISPEDGKRHEFCRLQPIIAGLVQEGEFKNLS